MRLIIVIMAYMCLASCVPKEKKQIKSTIQIITYQYKKSDNKNTNYLEKEDSLNLCKY